MTIRALARLAVGYVVLLLFASLFLRRFLAIAPIAQGDREVIESQWVGGELISRSVRPPGVPRGPKPSPFGVSGVENVEEEVVGEGPLFSTPALLSVSLVPGRDGVKGMLAGRTAWVTADDLLAAQAYDHASVFAELGLPFGADEAVIVALLADRLRTSAGEVRRYATLRRVRFERSLPAPPPPITKDTIARELVKSAAMDAARYLARGVDDAGRFRYLVAAPSDQTVAGYNWPRHAGATYFLAQAAALSHDPEVSFACLRAAALLRDEQMLSCGDTMCVGEGDEVDVGSSALALIAFAEIVETGQDPSYRTFVKELARFLRSQQKNDGEFMHLYDRAKKKPIDVQLLYYSGEATLALSRAHSLTNDPADLDAAARGLASLVRTWTFFGSRYYFGEEHWTCQAMADLWDRAPSDDALELCLRWHAYQRRLQYAPGEAPFDADGAFGVSPFISPRVTPASSRGEAAAATLDAARRARAAGRPGAPSDAEQRLLDDELRRALAFVLRAQLRPGPVHLFAVPGAVYGAIPGSAVDWQLRIDYPQHAGSMMIRWLELDSRGQSGRR